MAFISFTPAPTGLVGVNPPINYLYTTDSLATITTAGYLNGKIGGVVSELVNGAIVIAANTTTTTAILLLTLSDGVATLSEQSVSVTLPTIVNHIATYTNVSGSLGEDASTAINGGNIQAGLSGTSGYLASFPSTSSTGSLRLAAVSNSGNTVTTISNASMGQASTISIPDPGASTANFLLSNGNNALTKTNGTESSNAVTASGICGVITTSSLTTAAGSSYAITWTNTKVTSTSVINFSVAGGTNTRQSFRIGYVAGNGTVTLTIYNNEPVNALNGTILIGYTVW